MKFSVIIPNYNHAPFLRLRIESVLSQTYKDYEVILLDDSSSDNSVDILKEYIDNPRVTHYLFNKENSGSTFKQWLKGFNLASGEYIWIAESDDYADSHFLERAATEIENSPNISLLFYQSNIVNEKNEILHKHNNGILQTEIIEGAHFIHKYMLRNNHIVNASSVIFKKNTIPTDLMFTRFRYCGDWLFWSEIAAKGDVCMINEYMNYFRMHSNKVTPNSLKKGLKYIEGSQFYKRILELGGVRNPIMRLWHYMNFCSDMLTDIYILPTKRNNIQEQMKPYIPKGTIEIAKLKNCFKKMFKK